ncbi:MAG: choice-of-anchor J domain-containing protein [Clostridium sp.]|nr:choice-of-anchor J domain-containing protein [Clostridium sp.]
MGKFTQIFVLPLLAASALSAEGQVWSETFDDEASLSQFTIIDANNDGKTWEYNYQHSARITYNGSLDMDDWLISPAITLEAGAVYKFSIDAKNSMGTEAFEAFAGNAPAAEAMTISVIEKTDVKKSSFVTYEGEFSVPSDGNWHIGVHGCSKADQLYLYVDNMKLTRGVSANSPEAVTGLKIKPDANGLDKITISGTFPTKDVSGKDLASIEKAEVACDGDVIASFNGAIGAAFEQTIDAPGGRHKFTVAVYSGGERGREASAEVFVGPNIPGAIPYLGVGEFTPGEVTVRWQCPTMDVDGNPLNPELVTYKVVRYEVMEGSLFYEEDIEGADNIAGTEYVHKAIEPNAGQMYTAYGVYAKTAAGSSKAAKTPLFPVGTAYAAPYSESFAQGKAASLFRSETVRYTQVTPSWDPVADASTDTKAADGDGGYLAMMSADLTDCARFYSGKIDLSGLESPALTFYAYNPHNGLNAKSNNTFGVYVNGGTGFALAKEFTISSLGAYGWNRVSVPLDEYKGKTIQFAFETEAVNYVSTLVDAIAIGDYPKVSLAAVGITVPAQVTAGKPFSVKAAVENRGSETQNTYTVKLSRDGALIGTAEGISIAPDAIAEVEFTVSIGVHEDAQSTVYSATIEAEGDASQDDNTAESAAVEIISPSHPSPSSLSGTAVEQGMQLQWQEPAYDAPTATVKTEDFEEFESFATGEVNGWTMLDLDGGAIGKFENITFPGITVANQGAAFWVMDANLEGLNSLFGAYSGSKYLAQMYNAGEPKKCDDWAISPELFGKAQTVTFYAKSYSTFFGEEMEVLYSTGSMEPSDFVSVKKDSNVPNAWTRYEVELPEGARRFAIRCTSNDCYMLMVDDVTYTTQGKALELMGYNVYRNGERINKELVSEPRFIDAEAPEGTHAYTVTAVYDAGESMPGNEFTTTISGINGVSAEGGIIVKGEKGHIYVNGAQGNINVYSIDGRLAARAEGGEATIEVPAGIYVVTAGNLRAKVAVN